MQYRFRGKTSNALMTPRVTVNTKYDDNLRRLTLLINVRFANARGSGVGINYSGNGMLYAAVTRRDITAEYEGSANLNGIELDFNYDSSGTVIRVNIDGADGKKAIPVNIALSGSFTAQGAPSFLTPEDISFASMSANETYYAFPYDPHISLESIGFGSDTVIGVEDVLENTSYRIQTRIYKGLGTEQIHEYTLATDKTTSNKYTISIPLPSEEKIAEKVTDKSTVFFSIDITYAVNGSLVTYASVKFYPEVVSFSEDVYPSVEYGISPHYPDDSIVPDVLRTLYIRGFSAASITCETVTPKYKAEIKSVSVSVDGKKVNAKDGSYITDILKSDKTYEVVIEATDSRGLTIQYKESFACLYYNPPRVSAYNSTVVTAERSDEQGNEDDTGDYAHIVAMSQYSSLGGKNETKVFYRVYQNGTAAGVWIENDGGSVIDKVILLASPNPYTVELSCTDLIYTDPDTGAVAFTIPSAKVFMHKSKKLNSIGFGGYVFDENTVYVAPDMTFKVANYVNGVCLRKVAIRDGNAVSIKTSYEAFEREASSVQAFFIFTASAVGIIQGVLALYSDGNTSWRGTEGVTFSATNGSVTITLPESIYDSVIILSNKYFEEEKIQ